MVRQSGYCAVSMVLLLLAASPVWAQGPPSEEECQAAWQHISQCWTEACEASDADTLYPMSCEDLPDPSVARYPLCSWPLVGLHTSPCEMVIEFTRTFLARPSEQHAGGFTGAYFERRCPEDASVIELSGTFGDGVASLEIHCQAEEGASGVLAVIGAPDGIGFELPCPEGQVIQSLAGRAGDRILALSPQCGSQTDASTGDSPREGSLVGLEGGEPFFMDCPSGERLVGFEGTLGEVVTGLQPVCSRYIAPEAAPVPIAEVFDEATAAGIGWLGVSSMPRGPVFVDGEPMGVETPARHIELTAGDHEVHVFYTSEAVYSETKEVLIREGVNTNVFFRWRREDYAPPESTEDASTEDASTEDASTEDASAQQDASAEDASAQQDGEEIAPRPGVLVLPSEVDADSSGSDADNELGIQRVTHSSYVILASLLAEIIGSDGLVDSDNLEIQPAYDNGDPRGLRLARIPSGSFYAAAGIRRGDVLLEFNGIPFDVPADLVLFFEALQNEELVELVVQRRGRQRTLTYTIVSGTDGGTGDTDLEPVDNTVLEVSP